MALIECPECKNQISDTAKRCPLCGFKRKTKINKKLFIYILVGVLLVSSVVAIVFAVQKSKQSVVQKPKYEEALDKFVEVCFNGECSVDAVLDLAPTEYWYERSKQLYLYSPEEVAADIKYNYGEIIEKCGDIDFKYKINNAYKLNETKVKEVEERLSWIYEDINIDVEQAYYIDFKIYSSDGEFSHDFIVHSICIEDEWYVCQAESIFPGEGIYDFSIISYQNDYIEALLDGVDDEMEEIVIEEVITQAK